MSSIGNDCKFPATVVALALAVCSVGASTSTEQPSYAYGQQVGQPQGFTSSKFLPGPGGLCILNEEEVHNRRYQHEDENGRCCCSLCNPGSFARSLCKCSSVGESPQVFTQCKRVARGFYMPTLNKCPQPYTCTESCNTNQIKVRNCTSTNDIKCECRQGWFNPHPNERADIPSECQRMPLCPAGQGVTLEQVEDSEDIRYVCQPCPEGFYQGQNDSYDECRPHRDCLIQGGDAFKDNLCYKDPEVKEQQQDKKQQEDQEQQKLTTQPTLLASPTTQPSGESTPNSTAKDGLDSGTIPTDKDCAYPSQNDNSCNTVPRDAIIGILVVLLAISLGMNIRAYRKLQCPPHILPIPVPRNSARK